MTTALIASSQDDFEIVTEPGYGNGPRDWVVRGMWHGARRVVFGGDIFECCHWVAQRRAEEGA